MSVTLRELVGGVESVRTLVAEITTASSEQSQSIMQVGQSVQAIEGSTQQNSALVEQVAAAAHSLSTQTERLTDMVRCFRVA